ncbi:cyclin-dependent protein kinase inhibitor SMR6-like [Cicer arietinum]|uniref:Cyclin-dependent protein kinase inhibitor SMR6-like n=1 Tax=Cicer arietinum TaxID=3827 RepID=A0A1S2YTJ0_CICAR|nr:cyclin-dependent protein kinase inhibitor SMR6-like [Cicer arietinum]
MGYAEKAQVEGGFDSENNRKWVIAGISLRAPLKPIYTIPIEKEQQKEEQVEIETEECCTPTSEESKIPTLLTCPPAPRKQKASLKCNYLGGGGGGVVREFFKPQDLESVFMRHVESAN